MSTSQRLCRILSAILISFSAFAQSQVPTTNTSTTSGNPIFKGWYADPEGVIFGNQYWIYPTYSAPYEQQVHLDAFSSPDLVHWTKHPRIVDTTAVRWVKRALWAPAIVEKGGQYFLFFGANDIHDDKKETGGIGVAVADNPAGPFRDYLGKPLVGQIHNGAQPIDQFVFKDQDGAYYLIYGGWGHCNIARLNDDFTGFIPFADGTTFREVTPKGYVEGPVLFVRNGRYYFMWSEGNWTGPDYAVAYAVAQSPFGPFERVGKILQQDPVVAKGAGHHSVIHIPGRPESPLRPVRRSDTGTSDRSAGAASADEWYIVYHRRPLTETDGNHRETCIDRLSFDAQGNINPVKITTAGVQARVLK